jgi:methylated-DNA-[protein]-cysteine S-methyltransferase
MMKSNTSSPDYQAVVDSSIPSVACLGIRVEVGQLTAIEFLTQSRPSYVEPAAVPFVEALREYFDLRHELPQLDLNPAGTPFQQRVWRALRSIPSGQVRRYGELAAELGSSARAVANACRANPLPLLVPCHRVVSATGAGGYLGKTSGSPLAIKLWLLQHEGYV